MDKARAFHIYSGMNKKALLGKVLELAESLEDIADLLEALEPHDDTTESREAISHARSVLKKI